MKLSGQSSAFIAVIVVQVEDDLLHPMHQIRFFIVFEVVIGPGLIGVVEQRRCA